MIRQPYFKITYNGKNVTADIKRYLVRISVADKVAGESDELSIEMEDTDGLWKDAWYPSKGDKIHVEIGYPDSIYSYGTFEVDEIEHSGPPDRVAIRALAAGITPAIRTKRSTAHEGKTLKQIAQFIASENSLSFNAANSSALNIAINRVTQDRETDLQFLMRIGKEYGFLFSVRDKQLVFTSVFDIEKSESVMTIDKTDLMRWSVKSTSVQPKKKAKVSYFDSETKEVNEHEVDADSEGYEYDGLYSDILNIRSVKAENKQQAETIAKAALHEVNSRQVTGSVTMQGNPVLMSGTNFKLTGLGRVSGKYHIESAEHSIDRSGGYICNLEIKKVG